MSCIAGEDLAALKSLTGGAVLRLAELDENHELIFFFLTPEEATASGMEIGEEMNDRF